ncbi:DUF547 domain-containing protein [Membranihabitans marinus]|uniref:DUF547 domain-containing protein n=1 Tax=Membranihabitans marinus TaxID=1227546 RepID=UPI001F42D26B|nr:DUF547 domain-containing protein [Membranihabitans marinus]
MKFLFSVFAILAIYSCKVSKYEGNSHPISHDLWEELLQSHVDDEGWVDYAGFQKDSAKLNKYTNLLSQNHPNDKNWSREEQLAYWINAYNAFTIQLVARHYPVASIKDIKPGIGFVNSVWDIKFIHIEERVYDLNNIEHGIIRQQFDEPRIHFAVNCASYSCPSLSNHAFTADQLDQQLTAAAVSFINDKKKNSLSPDQVTISSIFKWFSGDFTKKQTIIDFLNKYSQVEINKDADIDYQDYDWSINEQ